MNDKQRSSSQSREKLIGSDERRQLIARLRYSTQLELIMTNPEVSDLAAEVARDKLRKLELVIADDLENDRPHTYNPLSLQSAEMVPAQTNVPDIATSPAQTLRPVDLAQQRMLREARANTRSALGIDLADKAQAPGEERRDAAAA